MLLSVFNIMVYASAYFFLSRQSFWNITQKHLYLEITKKAVNNSFCFEAVTVSVFIKVAENYEKYFRESEFRIKKSSHAARCKTESLNIVYMDEW